MKTSNQIITENKAIVGVFFIVLLAFIVIFPFITIWMLNTLFKLGIKVTMETYFAALVLQMLFGARSYPSYKK